MLSWSCPSQDLLSDCPSKRLEFYDFIKALKRTCFVQMLRANHEITKDGPVRQQYRVCRRDIPSRDIELEFSKPNSVTRRVLLEKDGMKILLTHQVLDLFVQLSETTVRRKFLLIVEVCSRQCAIRRVGIALSSVNEEEEENGAELVTFLFVGRTFR